MAPDPFHLVCTDADRSGNPDYLAWALRLSRSGTVVVGDNVVRDGALADPAAADLRVVGVRRFLPIGDAT